LDYLEYVDAENFREEKQSFIQALAIGRRYDPQYTYPDPDNKRLAEHEQALRVFKQRIPAASQLLHQLYEREIDHNLRLIDFIKNIGHNITAKGAGIFGDLDAACKRLSQAQAKAGKGLLPDSRGGSYSESELRDYVSSVLKDIKAEEWQLEIKEHTSIASVYPYRKKIVFNKQDSYSKLYIDTLIAHEIKGHIRQMENADKLMGLSIFKYGFGRFEPINEGYALWEESRANPVVWNRVYLYYLATELARNYGFYDTYSKLLGWLEPEDAFVLTYRVKRGLADTSQPGSNMKEKVYLEGLLMLSKDENEYMREIAQNCNFDHNYSDQVYQLYKAIK